MYRWLDRPAREAVRMVKVGPHGTLIERARQEVWIAQQGQYLAPAKPLK
jgi:hypothetical protein